MVKVIRLNHAVLFVRDASASAEFYSRVFGFEEVAREMGGQAIFMRSQLADNHHDLGLFSVGAAAPRPPRGATGLYHLAWEVPTIEALAEARDELDAAGASAATTPASTSRVSSGIVRLIFMTLLCCVIPVSGRARC